MTRSAAETIETFWRIQDAGDYTAMVDLFAEDAVLEDPFFGTFEGREAIAGFMSKMNVEMKKRETHFEVVEIDGGRGGLGPVGGGDAWGELRVRALSSARRPDDVLQRL